MTKKNAGGSFLYVYHVPTLGAIKIGFGDDAEARMRAYSREYDLIVDETSLRKFSLPSRGIANAIETACHGAVMEAGLRRVNHVVSGREAQELFSLQGISLNTALLMVACAVDEEVCRLHESLGKIKPKNAEVARQLREIAARRSQDELGERAERIVREARRCALRIEGDWGVNFVPFLTSVFEGQKVAKLLWEQVRPRILDRFLRRDFSYFDSFQKNSDVAKVIPFVVEAFHGQRRAREGFIRIASEFPPEVITKAVELCGKNIRCPLGKNNHDFHNDYPSGGGSAEEVTRISKEIFVFLDSESMEKFINRQPQLIELVQYAERFPRAPFRET